MKQNKLLEIGKRCLLILYAAAYLGLIFPEFEWDDTTVLAEDENGCDRTEEYSSAELQEAVYSAEQLTFSFRFLEWLEEE